MRYVLLVLLCCARIAVAGDAASCVQLGTTATAQSLKNVCGESIIVFWCHNSSKPVNKGGLCGDNKRYYRLTTMLKPGQVDSNPYSSPLGAHIAYGACFGDYGSYKYTDDKGGYLCKPPKSATKSASTMISTSSGPTEEEACLKAKLLASDSGTPGECACKKHGKISVCKVESSGPKPAVSVINNLKGMLRELAKCDPHDKSCKHSVMSNPGGIRG